MNMDQRLAEQSRRAEQAIADGVIRWEPGQLNTTSLIRVATDALAEIWVNSRASDDPQENMRREIFRARAENILRHATGVDFDVIKVPRR